MTTIQPDIVAVASGKGGVGKSTVAVNLAVALQQQGVPTGLVDLDLHGPDVPRMLNVTRRAESSGIMLWTNPKVGRNERIQPLVRHDVRLVSTQLLMGEDQAFAPEAGFAGLLVKRFLERVDWGDARILVVDLPPGTADVLQQLAATRAITGAVIVVTPQDVAHLDARKLLVLFAERSINVFGGVENMAPLRCPDCDATIELFPPTTAERTIWHAGVRKLASIPFDPALGRADQRGVPVVVGEPESPPAVALAELAAVVRDLVEHR